MKLGRFDDRREEGLLAIEGRGFSAFATRDDGSWSEEKGSAPDELSLGAASGAGSGVGVSGRGCAWKMERRRTLLELDFLRRLPNGMLQVGNDQDYKIMNEDVTRE